MTLDELIKHLNKLSADGKGHLEVFACHGASGAVDPVGHPHIGTIDGNEDMGPWDMLIGEQFIEIYTGN
tara:strand:- start:447 stop:653 length:207 start_codon:yes stop_codon:yes gene_type:complete